MSSRFANNKEAIKHLGKDPIMKKLIKKHKLSFSTGENNIFLDIIESIINQQLSSKAGETIFKRFKTLFNGKKIVDPQDVLSIADKQIRACGISMSKVSYIKGLSKSVVSGQLKINKLHTFSDEEVLSQLIRIKGIGKWTAEMILMFSLKRPDVFSSGDLGLCTAVARLYKIDRNNKKKIEEIALTWSPYRTIACRYLWRSLDSK